LYTTIHKTGVQPIYELVPGTPQMCETTNNLDYCDFMLHLTYTTVQKLAFYPMFMGYFRSRDHGVKFFASVSSINNYNKIYVSLLVDILNKTSRIVVLADELVYSVDITKSELTSPINFYSLVYTHPVLEKVDLTFFNPRLYNDLDKNVEDHLKSIKKDKDAQEKCDFNDSNCRQWFIPEETKAVYCLGCKEGFKFYEGSCKPQFVKKN
jgi:hypothetical protein